jgi:hypothetical protein
MALTTEDANSHFVAQDTVILFCSVNAANSEPLAARCTTPMNQVHNHRYYLLPFHFNIIFPPTLTSSNFSLPFRFHHPNFICTYYHPILATWSVHLAPTPILDQGSPFNNAGYEAKYRCSTTYNIALRPLVLTTIIQSASLATVECNAHACGRHVWSLHTSHFEQGRLATYSSKQQSAVNQRAFVLYLKPSTTRSLFGSWSVLPLVGEQTIKETKQKVSETGFASVLR